MSSPHRTTPTTPIRPVAPGRKARRLRAITVGFAVAVTALALMAGVASACAIPTCAHNQGLGPELDTDLGSAVAGVYEAQWLYRANGSSWQYTGRYRQAWSHGGLARPCGPTPPETSSTR
jgi:hypothetical protein